jgi:hypothetical protein
MPAATQIAFTQMNMNGARCHALFSSGCSRQTPRPLTW